MEKRNHISSSEYAFLCIIQEYIQNFKTSEDYIFHILQYFATKLHNFTKFRLLFAAMLMNVPNSNVCPQGELSIVPQKVKIQLLCILIFNFWVFVIFSSNVLNFRTNKYGQIIQQINS